MTALTMRAGMDASTILSLCKTLLLIQRVLIAQITYQRSSGQDVFMVSRYCIKPITSTMIYVYTYIKPIQLMLFSIAGNERVGPTSVMEAATLLLEAATCEAKPQKPHSHDGSNINIGAEIAEAKSCRLALEKKGIHKKHRQWLARLVTTRRIVILPTANALGYYQNTREENGIDPNRYAYCMHNMVLQSAIDTPQEGNFISLPLSSPSFGQRLPYRCSRQTVMHADYSWQDH